MYLGCGNTRLAVVVGTGGTPRAPNPLERHARHQFVGTAPGVFVAVLWAGISGVLAAPGAAQTPKMIDLRSLNNFIFFLATQSAATC